MGFDLKKLNVLFLENIPEMRTLITEVLEALEVGQVFEAKDSDEAFKIFCDESPDVVIAEGFSDHANGIELTRNIRHDEASPNKIVPVIITTGFTSSEHIAEARDAGATEYMVKPFTAKDLAKRLEHVINKPAEFIDHPDYFGPDRRRRNDPNYKGPERREDQN